MRLRFVCFLLACAFLTACTAGSQAALNTIRLAFGADTSGATSTPVNPDLRYLKVTSYGRPSYLVLGYVEPNNNEVWYSVKGEVLKTQAGRLKATVGLEEDWRNTAATPPAWQEVLSASGKLWQFERLREAMPGYRTMRETVKLQEVLPAQVQLALGNLMPQLNSARWFSESTSNLPNAFYAVIPQGEDKTVDAQVVFSYQCLKADLCMTFSSWAVDPASAVRQ